MDTLITWCRRARPKTLIAVAWTVLLAACAIESPLADPTPAFIARSSALRGPVAITAPDASAPYPADDRPLSGGERIETGAGARAILRLGSTALRIGPRADVRLGALDEPQVVIELRAGSIALRVFATEWAQRLVIVTPEGRWSASRPGHYRFDRWGDSTRATAWEGEGRFDAPTRTLRLDAGRRVELWFNPTGATIEAAWGEPVADEFAEWVSRDVRAEAEAAALRHVPPEVIGWEDLDAHGDWTVHPQWGSVWIPRDVGAGWAPYTDGRWTWSPPWGWVWVSGARWEFAPSHYGRWEQWRGRWVWVPGSRHEPPRFRPAPPEAGPPPRPHPAPPHPVPVPRPAPAQPGRPSPVPAPIPMPAPPPAAHMPPVREAPMPPGGRGEPQRPPTMPGQPLPVPAPWHPRAASRPATPGDSTAAPVAPPPQAAPRPTSPPVPTPRLPAGPASAPATAPSPAGAGNSGSAVNAPGAATPPAPAVVPPRPAASAPTAPRGNAPSTSAPPPGGEQRRQAGPPDNVPDTSPKPPVTHGGRVRQP